MRVAVSSTMLERALDVGSGERFEAHPGGFGLPTFKDVSVGDRSAIARARRGTDTLIPLIHLLLDGHDAVIEPPARSVARPSPAGAVRHRDQEHAA